MRQRLSHSSWIARSLLASIALMMLLALFVYAPILGANLSFLGISDDTMRFYAHLNAYGVIAFLIARSVLKDHHLLTFTLIGAAATLEELTQITLQHRRATLEDWLLNVIGILLWLAFSYHLHRVKKLARTLRSIIGNTPTRLASSTTK